VATLELHDAQAIGRRRERRRDGLQDHARAGPRVWLESQTANIGPKSAVNVVANLDQRFASEAANVLDGHGNVSDLHAWIEHEDPVEERVVGVAEHQDDAPEPPKLAAAPDMRDDRGEGGNDVSVAEVAKTGLL
jgi:hypothetical protein